MIYTLTLNPALDRELQVPEIAFDAVLRASSQRVDCGGKGFNVSRALAGLGAESVALGLVGGFAGQQLTAGLAALGIPTDFVSIAGETRTNVTIVGPGHHIKVNEAGPTIRPEELARLVSAVKATARAGDWWVLSGSLPPGAPDRLYADLIAILKAAGARAVLDTSGPALRHACAAGPFLAKPNAAEATELTGHRVESADDVGPALDAIHAGGVSTVLVSLGKRGAVLSDGTNRWRARPPAIEERNPIGAGDAMVAGLVWALSRSLAPEEALRWGVASGAAAAAMDGTAAGSREAVEALTRRVEIAPL
ncbi:MAG: 1-phosphofructokinase [Anaeromyxobacter sp.]